MVLGDVRIACEYGRHGQAHPEQAAICLEGDRSDENAAQSEEASSGISRGKKNSERSCERESATGAGGAIPHRCRMNNIGRSAFARTCPDGQHSRQKDRREQKTETWRPINVGGFKTEVRRSRNGNLMGSNSFFSLGA
jgi:hypothetical protein